MLDKGFSKPSEAEAPVCPLKWANILRLGGHARLAAVAHQNNWLDIANPSSEGRGSVEGWVVKVKQWSRSRRRRTKTNKRDKVISSVELTSVHL